MKTLICPIQKKGGKTGEKTKIVRSKKNRANKNVKKKKKQNSDKKVRLGPVKK